MGSINLDNQRFIVINITLEDLFSADSNAIRFVLASLGVHFLRKTVPDVAEQIGQIHTLTNWFFKEGQFVVCVGKKDFERREVEKDILQYINRHIENGISKDQPNSFTNCPIATE